MLSVFYCCEFGNCADQLTKEWKRKHQACPCRAKRTISTKKMLYACFLFWWVGPSSSLSIGSYSHWMLLQEILTNKKKKHKNKKKTEKASKKRLVRYTLYITKATFLYFQILRRFFLERNIYSESI